MSFILGGKTSEELGIVMLRESKRPMLPDARNRILTIPGRNGSYDFGADLDARQIQLECAFNTNSPIELQQAVASLNAHLLDGYGKPRTMQLVLNNEPTKLYNVRYAGSLGIDRLVGLGKFTLPLVAYDPFAYLDEPILNTDILLDSDVRLGGERYTFDITSNQTVIVPNAGSLISKPQIAITGWFMNLSLLANGNTMTYNESLTNQTLIIDCNMMTAKVDGVNKLSKLGGLFIEMLTGDNNVTISGTGMDFSITFIVNPRFI